MTGKRQRQDNGKKETGQWQEQEHQQEHEHQQQKFALQESMEADSKNLISSAVQL
jgi:hypothetical protein